MHSDEDLEALKVKARAAARRVPYPHQDAIVSYIVALEGRITYQSTAIATLRGLLDQ